MNKKIIFLLKKIYFHENGFFNHKLNRHEYKIPETITQEQLDLLTKYDFLPNTFETFCHDSSLDRLIDYKNKITLEFATAMFLKGLTGDFPRGRQTLMSYIYIKNLYPHKFIGDKICEICGLPKSKIIDKTNQLYTYYLGHSWSELPIHFLIELDEIIKLKQAVIGDIEKNKLKELLNFISEADDKETPGKLEKRIAKNKMLPKTDKYKRYGILMTLSECGILPNDFIKPLYDDFITLKDSSRISKKIKTSIRSDIILPLAGWKGKNGVNFKRYKDIFKN